MTARGQGIISDSRGRIIATSQNDSHAATDRRSVTPRRQAGVTAAPRQSASAGAKRSSRPRRGFMLLQARCSAESPYLPPRRSRKRRASKPREQAAENGIQEQMQTGDQSRRDLGARPQEQRDPKRSLPSSDGYPDCLHVERIAVWRLLGPPSTAAFVEAGRRDSFQVKDGASSCGVT